VHGFRSPPTSPSNVLDAVEDPSSEALADLANDPLNATTFGDGLDLPTTAGPPYPLSIRGAGEMLPRADNRVTLDRSQTDSYGRPVPSIDLSDGEHERETIAHCREIQKAILSELGAEVTGSSTLSGRDMSTHHMGTTRMGTDPTESVVNEECRTHDLSNLWIASSSVFPTGGANNPTLTIGALAIKTADHIDETL